MNVTTNRLTSTRSAPRRAGWLGMTVVLLGTGLASLQVAGADLGEVRELYLSGQYDACIETARQGIADGEYAEDWRLYWIESEMARGRYTNALAAVTGALDRYSTSIRIRLTARKVYLFNGETERADIMLSQINYLASNRIWAYRDPVNLVGLGQAALMLGVEARTVLEQFYDQAKRANPELRDVYLASGNLALDKGDYRLAATVFQEGLNRLPADPELNYGLARAFRPSDAQAMSLAIAGALERNTNHAGCYLLLADHFIDAEKYDAARDSLESVWRVNPWSPEAWAYEAVLAHLKSDEESESIARAAALRYWTNNPAVDHLIGKKLSQKYRFAEGSAYQRQALAYDAHYLPARIQLAQDLMRLGDESEGWRLAESVYEEDGYDVTAYNLVTLKEGLDQYTVLTNADFQVKMAPREAEVYGPEALALLQNAKNLLCAKYGLQPERPTIVEIFENQNDFGVRTFGMPHNPGFLGVCFGSVITANSPASQTGSPNNWQAVLWHEFCHVVTLQLTKNKMPRWLSEGISVFEERQANPAWGQSMNPRYRELILEDGLTPVGDLSAAFLTASSDLDMQFAYFQSYLVVEFLVRRYGIDSLKRILRDLGDGREINDAIARHTAPLEEIETEFKAYAEAQANALGPELDWDQPEPESLINATPEWLEQHSKNYYVLMDRARRFIDAEQWSEAKAPLQTLIDLYPDQTGAGSAYMLLAESHRNLNESDEERVALSRLAVQDADAVTAYLRLMELAREDQDWLAVFKNAERYLAVNPMVLAPHQQMARASEALGQTNLAVRALENCLHLATPDPAQVHFQLAKLMQPSDRPLAKRHLLMALEEAPRFRDAHRLLLQFDLEPDFDAPPPLEPPAPSPEPTPPTPPEPPPPPAAIP